MNKKIVRVLLCVALVTVIISAFSMTAFAAGDVAGAIESTWNTAKEQVKTVVNNVVFPVVDMILAILFFVKVGTAYFDYRKHGQFEFTAPAILFACLIFTLTAPLYIWTIIYGGVGMNFFEGELRQMFGNAESIRDAKFVGRTMLGKLGDDLLVKAQFISTHVSKQYDAIQVSILNRTDGVVDKETMLFGDIIGQKNTSITGRVNPYMWEESVGKAYWYTPVSISEKAQISDTVLDYVEMFQENNLTMQFK